MSLIIESGDIHLLELQTRMPFKYGIATMTQCPHAFVYLQFTVDGKAASGVSADHLPPKWFTKDPAKPIDDEIREMLRVIENALALAAGICAASPFEAWQRLFAAQDAWGKREGLPPLLVHFGTSLVERALIDGYCRAVGRPFVDVLRDNKLGLELGSIHSTLSGRTPAEFLPAKPLTTIIARHTVGLADPLTETDITAEERLDDGLPQSLEACIKAYGLRHFKIKICGDMQRDQDRLQRIAELLERTAPADFAFSLDGNEQFHEPAAFREYWNAFQSSGLRAFFDHLLFVEQPLHREVALNGTVADFSRDWPNRPPIIIDESDGELDSLPRALQLGYAGTSHKNCKGVFKGIANACLLAHLRKNQPGKQYLMSGEDLANIGPVALLQDLTVDAALGVASVERNGHHYFAGLSMFPDEVQKQMLQHHGDLFRPSRAGWPTLDIRDGQIKLDSLLAAPFGFGAQLNVEEFPVYQPGALRPSARQREIPS